MIIRPAKKDDAETIGILWEDLIAYHRELDENTIPPPSEDGAMVYTRRVNEAIEDDLQMVFVVEIDERVVGYVMGMISDMLPEMFEYERGGFLADIYVEPEYRGTGAGSSLVRALKNWFYGRHARAMEWYVAAGNTAGQAFWRKMGGVDSMIRMRADLTFEDTN